MRTLAHHYEVENETARKRTAGEEARIAISELIFRVHPGLFGQVFYQRGFERRSVRVARRGPDKSAIADGVRPGERVALERPEEIVEP